MGWDEKSRVPRDALAYFVDQVVVVVVLQRPDLALQGVWMLGCAAEIWKNGRERDKPRAAAENVSSAE